MNNLNRLQKTAINTIDILFLCVTLTANLSNR